MISPFVEAADLPGLAEKGPVVLADVRFYLDGRSPAAEYRTAHLPGAVYVDLEADLSGPSGPGSGRHPLPKPDAFARAMSQRGIGDDTTVVAYDDTGGIMAGRLVWMLRALGRPAAVLNGGLQAWAGELEAGDGPRVQPGSFTPAPWPTDRLADIDEVAALSPSGETVLLDARDAARYAGEAAGPDPRAGHIPGARNAPVAANLGPDGRLAAHSDLLARLKDAGVVDAEGAPAIEPGGVIASCGSGVTACHHLLVMEQLGLPPGRLYVGSWSQWSASARPLATGAEPGVPGG